MRRYLQLVATGPELSKSLDEEQAEDGMSIILNKEIDDVRTGIFLIALRMKRESEAENIGVLNALIKSMDQQTTRCAQVLAIADPFNGYLRGLQATAFLPAVYAACGLPTYIHGVESVGPKYGVTANMILNAAGVDVDSSLDSVAHGLESLQSGWGYVDQSQYIPKLNNLVELRDIMVKRSCISTLEVVLKPLSGESNTHLLTGFVHKAYPPVYAVLAKHAGFDSAMIVRGVEGGCIPSLSQVSRYFGWRNDEEMLLTKLTPAELGINQKSRAVDIPEQFEIDIENTAFGNTVILENLVKHNLQLGLEALADQPGPMRDSLIYGTAIGLYHTGLSASLAEGAEMVRTALSGGEALNRFNSLRTQE